MADNKTTDVDRRTVLTGLGAAGAAGLGGAALMSSSAAASGNHELDIGDAGAVATDDGSVAYVALGTQGEVSWEGFDESVEQFDWKTEISVYSRDTEEWIVGSPHDQAGDDPHMLYEGDRRDSAFGREDDEFVTGTRGRITFNVDDPGVSGGKTWLIAQNDEIQDAEDNDDLPEYDFPAAVDVGYGLPDNPLDTEVLTVSDDGNTTEYVFEYKKTANLYDENDDNLTEEYLGGPLVGTGRFTLDVENIPADGEFSGEGDTAAGGDPEKSD